MKKFIVAFIALVVTGHVFAQTGGVTIAVADLNFKAGKMKEGVNTLTKVGQGTLTFVKKGETFSEVMFKDAAGVFTRLITTPPGTGGAPNPGNKTKSPDTCFGTANKSVGMCVTKSGNVYTVTFMTSGVQQWVATYK
ncbi:MAG: hypothetical protein ABIN74_03385 [Ferruginibacter sp.]